MRKNHMRNKKNLGRTARRTVSAAALSLAFVLSAPLPLSSLTALAGPSDEAGQTQATVEAGPSGPGSASGEAPVSEAVNSMYYDNTINSPVVNPVDKYSYEQMEQDINALKSRYPNQMQVQVMGQSADGRNLYDVILGNPSASKHILIQGTIHGREYINVPLMMQQMEYLLAFQNSGSFQGKTLSSMLDQVAVHFVPLANPDGAAISQGGEEAIRSQQLRELIRAAYAADTAEGRTSASYETYLRLWKSNGRGVDLNHNFDAGWAGLATTGHPSYSGCKGDAPLSEPETAALAKLIEQYPIVACINYHAMGNVLYWDTAGNRQTDPSRALAELVSQATGYQILGSKGVGGLKDWLQQREQSIPGITIEVGRSTCPVNFSEYGTIWNQNKAVPALIIDYVISH